MTDTRFAELQKIFGGKCQFERPPEPSSLCPWCPTFDKLQKNTGTSHKICQACLVRLSV
jgi:hypothetical protein